MSTLKSLRKEAGLTLQKLATSCGLSKTYIWELENTHGNPTLKTAYAIATVLSKTVYEIWPDETEVIEETMVFRRIKQIK